MANQSKEKYLQIGRQRFANGQPRPTDADIAKGWQQRAIAEGWDNMQAVDGHSVVSDGEQDVTLVFDPTAPVDPVGTWALTTAETRRAAEHTRNAHESHGAALHRRAGELYDAGNHVRAARLYAKAAVYLNHA